VTSTWPLFPRLLPVTVSKTDEG